MPEVRGAALEAQASVSGIPPQNFATGGEGARGLVANAGVAVSLRRPDIPDDVLGGNLAGEAANEPGRRWAFHEPVTRASCKISVFSPGSGGR